ncbi:hypothetical protein BIZ38_19610 [Pseudoalteromonas sp. BZK2]|jgi:hypothetical protein|uniref:hypothetical protein n=1 Tax=Pseudoalteromonas sp. BZK2 TaxID=1904458 RepID=UPI001654773E|nr:hypothetical protein [Pseudoalteromonas sp. BZK2]MBC7010655.1 hypothetical protein [Pseudoalteromonas sp. BZK2]
MKTKHKGATTAAMTLLLTSGMLASAIGVRQVNSEDQISAWTTNKNLSAGQVITVHDVTQIQLDKSKFPNLSLSIQNPRSLIGKKLAVNKNQQQLIFDADLVRATRKNLSEAIPAGRVLYTLKLPSLDIPLSRIHKGDRLDIVAKTQGVVRTVAADVQLIGVSKSPTSPASKNPLDTASSSSSSASNTSLVLAVLPKDVYSLAGISFEDNVSVIVHSAYDIEQGRIQKFERLQRNRKIEVVKGTKNEAVLVSK